MLNYIVCVVWKYVIITIWFWSLWIPQNYECGLTGQVVHQALRRWPKFCPTSHPQPYFVSELKVYFVHDLDIPTLISKLCPYSSKVAKGLLFWPLFETGVSTLSIWYTFWRMDLSRPLKPTTWTENSGALGTWSILWVGREECLRGGLLTV